MKAILLAAGLGTRLKPLTDSRPKALVRLAGNALIDIVLERLVASGFDFIVINLHHFPQQIKAHLADSPFRPHIHFSLEKEILETGGGIKKIVREYDLQEPVLVHNVDILSSIDLKMLYEQHLKNEALATLAVQDRKTKRYLVFDEQNQLCGRGSPEKEAELVRKPQGRIAFLGFCGIHVVNPLVYRNVAENKFSSIDLYLKLSAQGQRILGCRIDSFYWRDLGRPQDLQAAEEDIRRGKL